MPDPHNAFDEADPQDIAEVLDETVLDEREGVGEMRTLEELPDAFDVTAAEGDRDEDEALSLTSGEFDAEAFGDADSEEDHELDYRAATAEREDDLDGQGPEDAFDEDRLSARGVEGLDEVRDADEAEGGEDDVTNFQASEVSDADLQSMGYSQPARGGGMRSKPD